jgi:hypothetical protein
MALDGCAVATNDRIKVDTKSRIVFMVESFHLMRKYSIAISRREINMTSCHGPLTESQISVIKLFVTLWNGSVSPGLVFIMKV